jgi:hypothetical protein
MVFVDRLDLAVARAMQFGRTLRPDELRAVHFVIDEHHADELASQWREHGLANLSLELIDCPDRRLARAAVAAVAHELSAGDAEVCVLLPERMFNGVWHRLLHDQTAEALAREISRLPHANVTTVPFHFDDRHTTATPVGTRPPSPNGRANGRANGKGKVAGSVGVRTRGSGGTTSIADVQCRQYVRVQGRVRAVRVEPLAGSPSLECTVADEAGAICVVFFGRRDVVGVRIGAALWVEGMAIEHRGRLAIVNPVYELQ